MGLLKAEHRLPPPPFKLDRDALAGVAARWDAYADANDGALPQTRVRDYLKARRDLAPKRFDFYHREIGRLLRNEADPLPDTPILPVPPITCPPLPPLPVPCDGHTEVPPPYVPAAPVPEPSTLGIALGMIAIFVVGRKFAR